MMARFSDSGSRRSRGARICGLAAAAMLSVLPSAVHGQRDSTPSTVYYATFGEFYDGEFNAAWRLYRAEAKGGIKTSTSYWIDSICYHTMAGECAYELGKYGPALDHYDAALSLYLTFNDWLVRVQFADTVRPSARGRVAPWGQRTRPAVFADIPDRVATLQGSPQLQQIGPNTVTQQTPQLFTINAKEIIRCTCLALRRKRELMGPCCAFDPLTLNVTTALAKRPCTPNHWSETFIDLQLGLAHAAMGRDEQARPLLQRSLVLGGEFDHDLTGIALLELGRIALAKGDFPTAATSFAEAGYAAYFYEDLRTLEDSLRYGTLTHLLANSPGVYPPLEAALAWATRSRLRHLQATIGLLLAENHLAIHQTSEASQLLDLIQPLMARRDMRFGRLGARDRYLTAMSLYQQGKIPDGDQVLQEALAFQAEGGSLWLFQIGIADKMYTGDAINARRAVALYDAVLRDPAPGDWLSDPLEALSKLAVPHPLVFEHWFDAAVQEKHWGGTLEIADLLRRHRFLTTLPMGGRLLSLRWLLEGPDEILDQPARQQRRDLLARYESYAQLAQEAAALRDDLAQMPLVVDDPVQQSEQATKLARLRSVSDAQEGVLREIAVRREPAPILFPPRLNSKELQDNLREGQAVLAFLSTSRQLYGFLITWEHDKGYEPWMVGSTDAVHKQLTHLLRAIGNHEGNSQVTGDMLRDEAWRKPAADLLATLFKGTKRKLPESIDELIVVPDGKLWYLPFEALLVPDGEGVRTLISKTRVRYVPTTSLALPDARGRRQAGATAVFAGQLYPGADPAIALSQIDQLAAALPGTVTLPAQLPAPSAVYSTLFDRLIVLQDFGAAQGSVYDWAPVPGPKAPTTSALDQWLALPWRGPDQVILPGFHTPAERSLKGLAKDNSGQEVFLSVCGLMASGARTVLLSRWRTGGASSFDLVREFAQELPHGTANSAWQRSVMLATEAPLDPDMEPRLKLKATDEAPTAANPFFWAGYLLVDTGATSKDSAEEPLAPPVAVKKKPRPKPNAVNAGAAPGKQDPPANKAAPAGPEEGDQDAAADGRKSPPAEPAPRPPRRDGAARRSDTARTSLA
jgi:CHAT domain-containing protein